VPPPMPPLGGAGAADVGNGGAESLKRKYRETLDVHAQLLQNMADTQQLILHELQSVTMLARRSMLSGRDGRPVPQPAQPPAPAHTKAEA